MGKIISFKKEEKLAILKIMIDLNNHYDRYLSDSFNIIQKTASFLNINNAISIACNLPISTAIETLKTLCENHYKNDFLGHLIAYMLGTGSFDIIKKLDEIKDEHDEKIDKLYDLDISEEESEILEDKIDEEYQANIKPILIELEKELHYCFKLMRECNSELRAFYFSYRRNPFESSSWIIINEAEELHQEETMSDEINTTGQKERAEAVIACSNEADSMKNSASYSNIIKETLYKDL